MKSDATHPLRDSRARHLSIFVNALLPIGP
jgi:hypothetical protein